HRIIAETVATARRPNDMTVNFALEEADFAIRPGEAQHRDEVGAQWLAVPTLALYQFIMHALHRDGEVAIRACPIGGVDAGLAAERIDLDAAIVSQRRQAGAPGREHRFQLGVTFERGFGLDRLRQPKVAR